MALGGTAQTSSCLILFGPLCRKPLRKQTVVSETLRQPVAMGAVCDPMLLADVHSSTTCLSGPPVAQCQVNTGTICKKMKQSFRLPSSASLSNHKCPKQKITSSWAVSCEDAFWGDFNQIPEPKLPHWCVTLRPPGKPRWLRPKFMLTKFYQSSFTGTERSPVASTVLLLSPRLQSCSHESSFPRAECTALTKAFPQQ